MYITGESATDCYLFYRWILKYESERAASGAGSLVIILCGNLERRNVCFLETNHSDQVSSPDQIFHVPWTYRSIGSGHTIWCLGTSLAVVVSYMYLIFPVLQGPFIDYFVETANEYPYLWALYAFVVVLPFVACAACCVRSKVRSRCKLA